MNMQAMLGFKAEQLDALVNEGKRKILDFENRLSIIEGKLDDANKKLDLLLKREEQ